MEMFESTAECVKVLVLLHVLWEVLKHSQVEYNASIFHVKPQLFLS
jgi:hypothetical protein